MLKTAVPKPAKSPKKPKRPLPRSSKPIAKKKRKPSEYARIYGSKARVGWVKAQPCVGCGRIPTKYEPNENAHIESGGIGRKADYDKIIPFCGDCHWISHHYGWTHVRRPPLTKPRREKLAAETEKLWQEWNANRTEKR